MNETLWNGKPYASVKALADEKGFPYPRMWHIVNVLKLSSDAELNDWNSKVVPSRALYPQTENPVKRKRGERYDRFIEWLMRFDKNGNMRE